MTDPKMLDAFRAMANAADDTTKERTESLQAEVAGALITWMRGLPSSLLPDLLVQLEFAAKAKETSTDPLAGMVAFFGQAPSANGSPLALGAGTGGTPASASTPATSATSLSPVQQELLDAFPSGAPDQHLRFWADMIRRSTKLSGDQGRGFPLAIDEMLDGKLEIDALGRPRAEAEIKRLNKVVEALETERNNATTAKEKAEKDLADEKAKAPAPATAAVDNDFRDAVYELIQTYYTTWNGGSIKGLKSTDVDAMKQWLDSSGDGLPAHIIQMKKEYDAWVTNCKKAANDALNALSHVSSPKRSEEVHGRQEVANPLYAIVPERKPAPRTGV